MLALHNNTSAIISKVTTKKYSTSFSLGIRAFHKSVRPHIYAIYAFARYADEIVDSFLHLSVAERKMMLGNFSDNTFGAINYKVSPYPVLHSFQLTVNEFDIPLDLIHSFFKSMAMDLEQGQHSANSYDEYIYGSAEVIGLMCLKVFVEGDVLQYEQLKDGARKLGAAFQKVNFLRDMKSDFEERGRVYFPDVAFDAFNQNSKQLIEENIELDFKAAQESIQQLPKKVRSGVQLAYNYYYVLFKKLCKASPAVVQQERVRVPDSTKFLILIRTILSRKLNLRLN